MALRELALSPKSPIHRREYYDRELTDTLRSFRPGEWAMLTQGGKPLWIAMVNPYSENGPKARALVPWSASYKQLDEDALAAKLIPELITRAIEWRAGWKRLSSGARLIYGDADGLPGLVVDSYQEVILAQLNSAGLDRHRELVRDELARLTGKKVYLYDSPEYRKNEGLPSFTSEIDFSELKIVESGITFTISREVLQKIGTIAESWLTPFWV
jgi:23S rRNA (cytosine1962-C5)-methyltransferase